MHRLTSCSVTLKKWVTNFELSRPSRNFPIEVGSEMAFFWLIWPRELPKIWKKDLWWPLAFHSCKKEGCNWFQITNPSEYTSQNTSRKWDFFWSLMPLVSMCIFRERFEEAEQMFFPQQFGRLIILLIKWGHFGGQLQCAISKGSSLRRLTWAAQCADCEGTKRIADKDILQNLWVDQVRSVLLIPTFQKCHASESNYLAHASRRFSPSEESLKKMTQVIVKQQWSSRWGEFDIWTPNHCMISKEKWFWLSWGHRWTDPERAVFFVFTYICKSDRCIIFFFLKFSTKPFCVRFHMSFEGFWSGLWRGWCDCSFKRPKKFVSGAGDRTWVITYICIFFLSLIKLDCIYMYLLFVSDEFFFIIVFLLSIKMRFAWEKNCCCQICFNLQGHLHSRNRTRENKRAQISAETTWWF